MRRRAGSHRGRASTVTSGTSGGSEVLRDHAGQIAQRPPSAYLTATAGDLAPGRALDAGCGHGAEALWLAARGWRVTAVDFSAPALGPGPLDGRGARLRTGGTHRLGGGRPRGLDARRRPLRPGREPVRARRRLRGGHGGATGRRGGAGRDAVAGRPPPGRPVDGRCDPGGRPDPGDGRRCCGRSGAERWGRSPPKTDRGPLRAQGSTLWSSGRRAVDALSRAAARCRAAAACGAVSRCV